MNLLFISPNSPYESIGGVERYITNLINYYKNKKDCSVHLIIPTIGQSKIKTEENVSIYFDHNFSIPRNAAHHQKEIAKNAQLFSNLVGNILKDKKIDVICAENFMFGPPAIYSLLLNMTAARHKVPIILRLHMYPASELQIELVNQLMWSKVSCVSKSVAGDCFQKGTDVNILTTDYLGVNTSEFNTVQASGDSIKKRLGLPEDTKIILTASRIIRGHTNILKEKGLINLIQAFSKLSPRYPNWRLVFSVGRATENLADDFNSALEMLKGYIKLNHIESKSIIEMFELVDMPDVYRGSDLFVLPSEMNETFGQTFVEAMSCGIPVIGAQTGGIPEIISDSYNGYLVQPDDSSILAHRIERLINDEATRSKFIEAGIKTVQAKFTSEKQFSNFHEMLEGVAGQAHNHITV